MFNVSLRSQLVFSLLLLLSAVSIRAQFVPQDEYTSGDFEELLLELDHLSTDSARMWTLREFGYAILMVQPTNSTSLSREIQTAVGKYNSQLLDYYAWVGMADAYKISGQPDSVLYAAKKALAHNFPEDLDDFDQIMVMDMINASQTLGRHGRVVELEDSMLYSENFDTLYRCDFLSVKMVGLSNLGKYDDALTLAREYGGGCFISSLNQAIKQL